MLQKKLVIGIIAIVVTANIVVTNTNKIDAPIQNSKTELAQNSLITKFYAWLIQFAPRWENKQDYV